VTPPTPLPSIPKPSGKVVKLVPPPTDAQLVASIRAGESDAVAALFDRYAQPLRRTICRVLGADPELDDVLQDVFLAAIERIEQLSDPSALRSWLTSIAVFTARGRIRSRQRWRGFLVFSSDTVDRTACSGPLPDTSEEQRALYEVLDRMPVDERICVCLRFLSEMQIGEIAEVCGVSHATAKRRVQKARARFDRMAERHPALRDRVGRGAS
jgi:RNA polymerase sigma-70 factor (ECF subfamily)